MASRLEQLQQLATQIPAQNQQIEQQLQQSREAQFRQAAATAVPGTAQQLGAATQQQRQQVASQVAQQQQGQIQQVGQLQAQEQRLQNQQELFNRKQSLDKKQRGLEKQLFNLGEDVKQKIWDSNLQFEKDELGRTSFNDRQLMDYAIMNAKSDEDLADFEQKMNFESQKRMETLRAAQAKIQQALKQGFDEYNQKLDNEQMIRLAKAQNELKKKMQEEANKAANRAAMFGAAGMAAGAVIGTWVLPGIGTAAGASLGQGAGTLAAGTTA